MEGSLSKWTNVVNRWQYRWFVLDDTAGLLSYYTSREKMIRGVRRGCVRLKGAVIGIDDEDKNTTFTITVDGKTFHFQARNFEEREKWVRCLEDTIVRHAFTSHNSTFFMYSDNSKKLPTLINFDKKVAEADAYLQLLIEQVKALELKANSTENEEKETLEQIIQDMNMMLEQVKHTIVLLQIAKNSVFPVNGTYQPQIENSDDGTENLKNDLEIGTEIDDKNMLPVYRPIPIASNFMTDIPEVSYSTSEEEDFYDACEEDCADASNINSIAGEFSSKCQRLLKWAFKEDGSSVSTDTSVKEVEDTIANDDNSKTEKLKMKECSPSNSPKRSPSVSTNDDTAVSGNGDNSRRDSVNIKNMQHNSNLEVPLLPDGSIDFDALYEDPSENEHLGESHAFVIRHLISQVKIGMDMTKVPFPTFVLERRSLLEMYADCFAHPDLFLQAADLETPKERMIQMVKWYLSSFHAQKKSAVAKKPYNPLLGEIFQCWWNIDNVLNNVDDRVNSDGPIPWCKKNQLVFLAEQVSHHPPISAFYAEHPNKKVSLCAHVWTKSKFLGLSLGVHNIGVGTVKLLEKAEEYIFTFPNGYCRSIITVPWIELGGCTTIKCPQTGYYCNVEFFTKPFYGGKKHKISAVMFGPKDKKPFLTISGEWNRVMEAKWIDGPTELFFDARDAPVIKKSVRRIEEQADNESRKIWRMVTLGLKRNDENAANNAKLELEQKQRDEAQLRKENNEIWEPEYFYEEDGIWHYKNPLEKRLNVEIPRLPSSVS